MKKITSILLAVVIAACTALSVSAAGVTRTALGKLKSVTVENAVFVLNRSVSVVRSLDVAEDELLAIPSGKTLTLKKGANIDGDIYVENGGRLVFSGGKVTINGSIVADGKVVFKSAAKTEIYGDIYVSASGTLSIGSDENFLVYDRSGAKIACLGKTNSKLLEVATKPIAAVLNFTDIGGLTIKTQTITDNFESVLPDPDKYYADEESLDGATVTTLYVFFDNGVCISANTIGVKLDEGDKYVTICGVSVSDAKRAINSLNDI